MARASISVVVTSPATGLPVSGASVAVSQRSSAAAVTWWSAETGGSSSTAALTTNANGRVSGWVDRGAYNLTISGAGLTTYVEPWDAVPAADLGGDAGWLPDTGIDNRQLASGLDAAKLTTGTLPSGVYPTGTIPGTALVDASVTAGKMAAGSLTRLLGAYALSAYILNAASTVTLLASTAVTHNNKAGVAVLVHSWKGGAVGSPSMSYRLYLDAAVVAQQNYTPSSSGLRGMVSLVYNYSTLSGSHNWLVDVTQSNGTTITGDGTGILLLFEQS